ncbi:hypothetical protein PsYK624_172950, partial [Phanerochaete sordida]
MAARPPMRVKVLTLEESINLQQLAVKAALEPEPVVEAPRAPRVRKESGYYECVKATRDELCDVVKEKLVLASGDERARMLWTSSPSDIPNVTYLYNVELVGWPADIVFDSPSRNSSLTQLTTLVRGFEGGDIKFVRMPLGGARRLAQQHRDPVPDARRVDTGKRPKRRAETLSRKKGSRKKTVKIDRLE